MKNKIFIFLVLFATELASCQNKFNTDKVKDEFFKRYISLFKETNLPFSTSDEMYCQQIIENPFVKRFICKEELCLKDWSGYDIEFGACAIFPTCGNYILLLYDESGAEGGNLRKIITYDYSGNKIDELEIFADKTFHGDRKKDEIVYYEIESIINEKLFIERKYFEMYADEWRENDKRFFHGRYIESVYKIGMDGKITLVSENDHGKKIYIGGSLDSNTFPRWKILEE